MTSPMTLTWGLPAAKLSSGRHPYICCAVVCCTAWWLESYQN